MATYQKADFDAKTYQAARPTYPEKFYKFLATQTKGPVDLAVDLACGTGIATLQIEKHIAKKTIGIDPSKVLVAQAQQQATAANADVEFIIGSDADIDKLLEPNSVDLLTIAEAGHWLSYPALWDRVLKVLKPNGTIAIWAYSAEVHFLGYPEVTELIREYIYSDSCLGPYWDNGFDILRDRYRPIVPPKNRFDGVVYHLIDGLKDNSQEPLEIVQKTKVKAFYDNLLSWSSYHNWKERHPTETGDKDVRQILINKIKETTGLTEHDDITLSWDTVYILAHKKSE